MADVHPRERSGISALVASGGQRSTLKDVAFLISTQLEPGDELIVDVNDEGSFGHAARNRMMARAKPGNWLWFLDDDDRPFDDALETIRAGIADEPNAPLMFKMAYLSGVLWRVPQVVLANVSTQMLLVRREIALQSRWGLRYEGDYDFALDVERRNGPFVWREEVICQHNGLRGY